jgi:hypothetical protein
MAAKAGGEELTLVDPMPIYFTFSRIRPQYSCGRFIKDTIADLLSGKTAVADLPPIAVLVDRHGAMFSLNNRRLFTFKELCRAGALTQVPVRLRPVPQTKRMAQKYTADKCSLTATLKGVKGENDGDDSDDGQSADEEGESVTPTTSKSEASGVADGRVAPLSQPQATAGGSRTAQKAAKRASRDGRGGGAGAEKQERSLAAQLAALGGGDSSSEDDVDTQRKAVRKKK